MVSGPNFHGCARPQGREKKDHENRIRRAMAEADAIARHAAGKWARLLIPVGKGSSCYCRLSIEQKGLFCPSRCIPPIWQHLVCLAYQSPAVISS
jgi:hypothetical protein